MTTKAGAGPLRTEGERLAKRVAELKGCSRHEAEQTIEGGWVTVNGVVIETPAFRVQVGETIAIDPDASLLALAPVTLILHKPGGLPSDEPPQAVPNRAARRLQQLAESAQLAAKASAPVSVRGSLQATAQVPPAPPQRRAPHPSARQRALARQQPSGPTWSGQLLTVPNHFEQDASGTRLLQRHFAKLDALVPLETPASGMLVFTQDWRVSRKLLDDAAALEHELIAEVAGELSPESAQLLLRPVNRGLPQRGHLLPLVKASLGSSVASSPAHAGKPMSQLRFAIKGDHPGLVAYLCEQLGLELLALRRIRIGRVAMQPMPPGQWRYLAAHERF